MIENHDLSPNSKIRTEYSYLFMDNSYDTDTNIYYKSSFQLSLKKLEERKGEKKEYIHTF